MKHKFNIIQNNINSLEPHKLELAREMKDNNIHACLLSETWTKESNIRAYNISGYQKIIQSRGDDYTEASPYFSKIALTTQSSTSLQAIMLRLSVLRSTAPIFISSAFISIQKHQTKNSMIPGLSC